jgi:PRC-barrel domain
MPTNAFEDSRISEGTMHAGAQHVASIPVNSGPIPRLEPFQLSAGRPSKTERPAIRRVLGVTTLTGTGVRNLAGDSLGSIAEIMIDLTNARIAYAVLSYGGFLGIGDKLFAVPWSALSFDQRANEFILDVQRETLENAPGFDKDNWPDMSDPVYGGEIHKHYGKAPYWENPMTDLSSDEFAGRVRPVE